MPALGAWSTAAGAVALASAGAGIALLSRWGYKSWKDARIAPEERERLRRAKLVERGKITDATLVEIRQDVLLYSYLVRGVEYIASQDVTSLKDHVPGDLGMGPVSVKYESKNPANSIVLAEDWSGLHTSRVG